MKVTPDSLGKVDQWMAKNRSLVLRQTPFWAQGVALVVIGLASVGVVTASIFKIDEVVTVNGRLIPSKGSLEVKSPVAGKLEKVYVSDGDLVKAGQVLAVFDTREVVGNINTIKSLIAIENKNLKAKREIYNKQFNVLRGKLVTNEYILANLKDLVDNGGYQKIQYLSKLDEVYEIQSNLDSLKLELERAELEAKSP